MNNSDAPSRRSLNLACKSTGIAIFASSSYASTFASRDSEWRPRGWRPQPRRNWRRLSVTPLAHHVEAGRANPDSAFHNVLNEIGFFSDMPLSRLALHNAVVTTSAPPFAGLLDGAKSEHRPRVSQVGSTADLRIDYWELQ